MGQHLEREISFDVGDRWQAPELGAWVPEGGRIVADQADLQAGYFDTDGQVLRRLGVTLRRRTGGSDAGWHLKIPSGSARLEVQSKSRGRWVPSALVDLLRGVLADRPLGEVATISTDRRTQAVLDADGRLLVELADDRVTASATGGPKSSVPPADQWREVEAELGPAGSEELLRSVTKALKSTGARRSATQVKLDRALGPMRQSGPDGPAAPVVRHASAQVVEVLRGDIALRMATDADTVHDQRVAIRRLRSVLGGYESVFDDRAAALTGELRWLGGVLGEIRDLDVLLDTVRSELDLLPGEQVLGPVAVGLAEAVASDRAQVVEQWQRARDGDRYRQLLNTLVEWLQDPPGRERVKPRTKRVLAEAERRLQRRLQRAGHDPAELHRARKAAKRLRYTAELAAPELDAARRAAKRAKKVQRLLGAHQDHVLAGSYLRALGARFGTMPGHNGYTYGLLAAHADQRAAELRRELARL